jgi:putative ABC transport system substrate-binding protein
LIEAFRSELRTRGYIEGQNVEMVYRYSEGQVDRLNELASELVRRRVTVIIADGTPATLAAKRATGTTPIVMVGVGVDPIQAGIVSSLAQPGANVTGVVVLGLDLWGKRLQLLKEVFPEASRAVVLRNPGNPANLMGFKELEKVAAAAGVRIQIVEARDVGDFHRAFIDVARAAPDVLIAVWDPLLVTHAQRIAAFATERRLPFLGAVREYVDRGALMSYAASLTDQWRRAAIYADKILKGAKPGDLPVEQPTKFDLVINMKTAKAIGLTIPPSLLARADQVIE